MCYGFATLVIVTVVHITQSVPLVMTRQKHLRTAEYSGDSAYKRLFQAALFPNGHLDGCNCATSFPCFDPLACTQSNEFACPSPLLCGRACRGGSCKPSVANNDGCIGGSCDPSTTLSFDQAVLSGIRAPLPRIENIPSSLHMVPQLVPSFQTMSLVVLSSEQEIPRMRTPYQRVPKIRKTPNQLKQNMASAIVTAPRGTPSEASSEEPITTVHMAEENNAPSNPKVESHIVGRYSSENNTHVDSSITSKSDIRRNDSPQTSTSNYDDPSSIGRNREQFNGHGIWSHHRSDQLKLIERTTNKVPTIGHPDVQILGEVNYEDDIDEGKSHRASPTDYQKKSAIEKYETFRAKDKPISITDTKCNNEIMRAALIDNISESVSLSKRKIQRIVTEQLGGRIDVICTRSAFSYVVNTELFCESEKNNVTCLVFKQSS